MTEDYLTGLSSRLQDIDYAIIYLKQCEEENGHEGWVKAWEDIANAHPNDWDKFWRRVLLKTWQKQDW